MQRCRPWFGFQRELRVVLMLMRFSSLSPSLLSLISAAVSLWARETQLRAGAPSHPPSLDKHSSAWPPSSCGSGEGSRGKSSPPPVAECRGADPGVHSKREIGFLLVLTPSSTMLTHSLTRHSGTAQDLMFSKRLSPRYSHSASNRKRGQT